MYPNGFMEGGLIEFRAFSVIIAAMEKQDIRKGAVGIGGINKISVAGIQLKVEIGICQIRDLGKEGIGEIGYLFVYGKPGDGKGRFQLRTDVKITHAQGGYRRKIGRNSG